MSPDLNWESYITFISSKAYKKLGLLRRTFSSTVSIWAKRSPYLTVVHEVSVYTASVLLTDLEALVFQGCFIIRIRIQRRATKFILGDYTSSYKSRLLSLNIATPPTHDGV